MKIPVRVPNNIKAKTENTIPIPIPIPIPRSMGSNRSFSARRDKKENLSCGRHKKKNKKWTRWKKPKKSVQVIEQLQFAGYGGKMKIVNRSFLDFSPLWFHLAPGTPITMTMNNYSRPKTKSRTGILMHQLLLSIFSRPSCRATNFSVPCKILMKFISSIPPSRPTRPLLCKLS